MPRPRSGSKLLQPVIASGLAVEIRAEDARIKLPSDVLFASGQFKLSTIGRDTVARVGRVLASSPGLQVEVEGHTDSQPIRGSTNWDLGFARARGVLEGLIGAGLPIERVKATSYGDSSPISDNRTPEGRAANRRIELIVRLPEA